jgi:hypothetical protein
MISSVPLYLWPGLDRGSRRSDLHWRLSYRSFVANLCHAVVMRSNYSRKIRQQGDSMEADSNKVAARDTENFTPEASGGSQISSTSKVVISTEPTLAFPPPHQPSSSADEQYQAFDQPNTFPNGYLYSDVNSWQQNGVSTGQYDDHSQQVTPSEASIGQTGTAYIDNSNLIIDRAACFNGNRPVQGVGNWSVGDAPPSPLPQTAAPT